MGFSLEILDTFQLTLTLIRHIRSPIINLLYYIAKSTQCYDFPRKRHAANWAMVSIDRRSIELSDDW